jgi:hypothetical protein
VTRRLRPRAWPILATAMLALSCGKSSYKIGTNMGSTGGSSSLAGSGSGGGSSGATTAPSCDDPKPGSAPLSRLTNPEIERSVRALLAAPTLDVDLSDGDTGGHYESSPDVEVSLQTVEALHRVAHDVAQEWAADPSALRSLSGCDPAQSSEASCKTRLLDGFVTRAFRRPLSASDRSDMETVFESGRARGGDYASGVRAVIEVTLQSPELLYLLAEGEEARGQDVVRLTGYETASRLSYFLTGAPPDDALWAAAERGPLDDAEISAQARRLLASDEHRPRLRQFYERHWGMKQLPESQQFLYTAQLAELTRESFFRFIEDVTFGPVGTFRELMTAPTAFMNGPLAEYYGVPGVAGNELQRVVLDASQRKGLLTQPAYLRSTSPSDFTRPVLRGIEVLKGVLCVDLPAPPASIPALVESPSPSATMRERLTITTSDPGCQQCHALINPVGLAFERYDAFGRFRETENGAAIDASGELTMTDARGEFADALELIERIAASRDAGRCFQEHWLTEAYRRKLEAADDCAIEQVSSRFDEAEGNIIELIVAVAQTDNLKFRPKPE